MSLLKKLAVMAVAIVAAAAIAVPAFAAGAYSITVNNNAAGHTYEAYQIFKGELSGGKLVSITWGSGVTAAGQEDMGDAAAKAKTLTDEAAVRAFAKEIAEYLAAPAATVNAPVGGAYVLSGLDSGYYLVKDKDGSLAGTNDSYTEYIVKVTDNTTVVPKSGVSTVQKKVKDVNDSAESVMTGWLDSADHDINDNVPFQLKAILAGNVASHNSYKVVFHDGLSAGLTYNEDAKMYLGEGENRVDVTSHFDVSSENGELTFACNDVKDFNAGNGAVVVIEYTAKLNEKAVLGSAGNPNTVYLEYSNNPNWAPDVNEGENEGDSPTGVTLKDKVIVFTYKVAVNKVDEDGKALEGAGFTLYKKDASGNYNAVGFEMKGATSFEWKGVDDGDYRLVETTTPAGYNTMKDVLFTVGATHDIESDNPQLIALSGDVASGAAAFAADKDSGALSSKVVNKAGVALPSTGGMGTTLFYAIGVALVLGAGIALVVRKRIRNN